MQISVLLFASYADAFGGPELRVDLPPRATVGDLVARMRQLPGGDYLPPSPLVAVNADFASADLPLSVGDEVALIPPVAGG